VKNINKPRVVLVYPNSREVAFSNLGFHKIFSAFNSAGADSDIAFLPDDGKEPITEYGKRRLSEFNLIAFSLTFEMDEINILKILRGAGLPILQNQRDDLSPLICAGGVAVTLNPEPLSRFIDFFVLGDGENVVPKIVDIFSIDKKSGRKEILPSLSKVDGIYVPSLFNAEGSSVKRVYNPLYGKSGMAQLDPFGESVFNDTFLIETGKGCGQGCRFCAAGFIYRPLRNVDASVIKKDIDRGLKTKQRIGLVGSAICEHPDINSIYEYIINKGGGVSVSSLRIGLVDETSFKLLHEGGCKTITIAPEAGSERLRRAINKGITDEQILTAVTDAVTAGILNIKSYFLIGLPFEEEKDITALIDLVKAMRDAFIKASKPFGRAGEIIVSINPFIPKPFTPFQWEPMEKESELKQKLKKIKKALSTVGNIKLKTESLKLSLAQSLLSNGSQKTGDVLIDVLDGKSWRSVLRSDEAQEVLFTQKDYHKKLPWEFIDSGIKREYLWKEYLKAEPAKTTIACPPEGSGCRRCGDFGDTC